MTEFSNDHAVLYRAGIGWFTASSTTDGEAIYFPISESDLDDFLKTAQITVEGSAMTNLSFEISPKDHLFSSTNA